MCDRVRAAMLLLPECAKRAIDGRTADRAIGVVLSGRKAGWEGMNIHGTEVLAMRQRFIRIADATHDQRSKPGANPMDHRSIGFSISASLAERDTPAPWDACILAHQDTGPPGPAPRSRSYLTCENRHRTREPPDPRATDSRATDS